MNENGSFLEKYISNFCNDNFSLVWKHITLHQTFIMVGYSSQIEPWTVCPYLLTR